MTTPRVYSQRELSALFGRDEPDWFAKNKQALMAKGFPAPLPGPGHPRWPRGKVDEWFEAGGAVRDTAVAAAIAGFAGTAS